MIKKLLLGLLAAASFNTMQGATVLHLLDETFSTGATPSGSGPWLTVTATDTAVLSNTGIPTSGVTITLESNLQSSTEFFDKVGFVWGGDSTNAPAAAFITNIGGDVGYDSISTDPSNSINTGVGTSVGLLVNFVNSNAQGGALRFNGTDTFEFTVYDATGFVQYDATTIFDSVGIVAHVNGIDNANSAWITPTGNIPEPSTALLGLLGLLPFMRRRR